ncbi:non-canonical purine NTP pyrophosphatase, partial [Leptospira santarosai]
RFGGPGLKDEDRALLLLEKMKGKSDRRAHYVCVIAFVDETTERIFEGGCEGIISEEYDRVGMYGFGYDPIFIYLPFQKPFSQVPESEKNSVSHRKKALEGLSKFLKMKS